MQAVTTFGATSIPFTLIGEGLAKPSFLRTRIVSTVSLLRNIMKLHSLHFMKRASVCGSSWSTAQTRNLPIGGGNSHSSLRVSEGNLS